MKSGLGPKPPTPLWIKSIQMVLFYFFNFPNYYVMGANQVFPWHECPAPPPTPTVTPLPARPPRDSPHRPPDWFLHRPAQRSGSTPTRTCSILCTVCTVCTRPSRTIEINASKFNGLIFFTTIDSTFDIVIHQTEPLRRRKTLTSMVRLKPLTNLWCIWIRFSKVLGMDSFRYTKESIDHTHGFFSCFLLDIQNSQQFTAKVGADLFNFGLTVYSTNA